MQASYAGLLCRLMLCTCICSSTPAHHTKAIAAMMCHAMLHLQHLLQRPTYPTGHKAQQVSDKACKNTQTS